MRRREFLGLSVAAAVGGIPGVSAAQLPSNGEFRELRGGYQRTGVPVIAPQRPLLEERFAEHDAAMRWIEFTSGPPLLEAITVGSVDIGASGDPPPVFSLSRPALRSSTSSAGPINNGRSIILRPGSSIQSLAACAPTRTLLSWKGPGHAEH
jgi:sulfonate transport system substrate-binding protein